MVGNSFMNQKNKSAPFKKQTIKNHLPTVNVNLNRSSNSNMKLSMLEVE